jgi:hypothetical protein
MTQHINTCTHTTCDASAQPKPWYLLDSDKDTFHSFHSNLPWRQILTLGFRFRCIIFMLRPLGYRCGTQCVRKRDCQNMVANPHPFGKRSVVQLVARYLNEWAIPVTAITVQHIQGVSGKQRYVGESNENLKSVIKIRNTARLSCKLATVILMVWRVANRWRNDGGAQHDGVAIV